MPEAGRPRLRTVASPLFDAESSPAPRQPARRRNSQCLHGKQRGKALRWERQRIFAVVPIGALFLSVSRGGIVSFGVELAVLALVMIQRRTMGKQLFAGAAVLLLALLMVSWLGVGQLLQRFSSFQSLEVTAGKRASMRRDTWQIFLHNPV